MNTVMVSFTATMRQMIQMFQWLICLSKKWPKNLSKKNSVPVMVFLNIMYAMGH